MAPRILVRNEQALALTSDAATKARLWAERAVLLARMLDLTGADEALAQAQNWAAQADPGAVLEARFAQAVCKMFHLDLEAAQEDLQTLRLQARQHGALRLAADCASVLAMCSLQRGQMAELVPLAVAAINEAPPEAQQTRYRANLALGMAHYYAGNFFDAHRYFNAAGAAARAGDDEIAQASLLEAAVIAQASEVRQQTAAGAASAETVRQALVAVQAAIENDIATGIHRDISAERLIEAELHLHAGQIDEALRLTEQHLPSTIELKLPQHSALGRAVRAVCRAELGLDGAEDDAAGALETLAQIGEAEVRGPVLGLVAQALHRLGRRDEATALAGQAAQAWAELLQRQRAARAALAQAPAQ